MENEVKNVRIIAPSISDTLSPQAEWEREWEKLHIHEPNNRQKRRRMEKDWEKHLSNKLNG